MEFICLFVFEKLFHCNECLFVLTGM